MKGKALMSKNVIFCFSGSGNCLDIAKNIAAKLGDTDIIMMRKTPEITDVTDAKTVGFVVPCHAGGLPLSVAEHIREIKLSPEAYTYGVGSYSGYFGTGLAQINRIVPLKYWAGISHHCSCIWLFPHSVMMPMLSAEDAEKRSEELAAKIAVDVLAGKMSGKEVPNNPINAIENRAWPVLAGKKADAFAVSDECIGCGQCVKLCPKGNIHMYGGKAFIGTSCIQCLSCLQYCPTGAISIGAVSKKRERYHNPNVTAAELMQPVIHID
jgi:ferredoxin